MSTDQNKAVLTERITLENSGGQVLVISLNRPDRLNCFDTEVCQALCQIFSKLSDDLRQEDTGHRNVEDQIVAVILKGIGRSFCAGADLSNPPSPLIQSSDLMHHLHQNPTYFMGKVSVPIIVAIQGHVSNVMEDYFIRLWDS